MGKKNLFSGLGVGAILMYLFDPQGGGRRRALVRDKLVRFWTRGSRKARGLSEDVSNRVRGRAVEAKAALRKEHPPDEVLVERVRSETGHVVSHPGAIEVSAASGVVTLRGPVLAEEVGRLLATVRSVRGVRDVIDELEVHSEPGGVPGLQAS